jgi:hypothetical protein
MESSFHSDLASIVSQEAFSGTSTASPQRSHSGAHDGCGSPGKRPKKCRSLVELRAVTMGQAPKTGLGSPQTASRPGHLVLASLANGDTPLSAPPIPRATSASHIVVRRKSSKTSAP